MCSIQSVNSGSSGRFDGIDLLRGISIIAVVVHHINIHMGASESVLAKALPRQLAATLFWNGANGVTVFFAISGFLITTMAIRRWGALSQVRIADFYRLRFARIVPLLIALLVILSVLDLAHVSGFIIKAHTSLPRALLAAATFHINWLESQRGYLPANWDVLWSLSVEEVFYLFFPLICILTRARAPLIALLMAFVAVGPFARTVLTHNELWADYGYLSCMDAIALGCLAAMIAASVRFRPATLRALQIIGRRAGAAYHDCKAACASHAHLSSRTRRDLPCARHMPLANCDCTTQPRWSSGHGSDSLVWPQQLRGLPHAHVHRDLWHSDLYRSRRTSDLDTHLLCGPVSIGRLARRCRGEILFGAAEPTIARILDSSRDRRSDSSRSCIRFLASSAALKINAPHL